MTEPAPRCAQMAIVGSPVGPAATVRATQVGGIFIGNNATDLLHTQALREVHAMAASAGD